MLKSLAISNFAVIRQLSVEFHPGLNVITGETGAGKSILVDALGLLCGGRAGADLLRTDEERLRVEALFEVEPRTPAARWLQDHSPEPVSGGEILLRREVGRDGRSRAWIGGSPITLSGLKEVATVLVQIQGQHGQQDLLGAPGQRDWLDAFAGLNQQRAGVAGLFAELRHLEQQVAGAAELERERLQSADLLRFQIKEIDQAQVRAGEDGELEAQRQRLRHAERLRQVSSEALQALYEDDVSAVALLGRARSRLEEISRLDPQAGSSQAILSEAAAMLEEVAHSLSAYQDGLEFEPGRLEAIEERYRMIESLKRKYGGSLSEVLAFAQQRRQELADLERLTEDRAQAQEQMEQARICYWKTAEALSTSRRKAASRLSAIVERELTSLAMKRARFHVSFAHAKPPWEPGFRPEAGSAGADEVEFRLAANVGEEERSLARVASGGELSRVLLALHVSVEESEKPRTLVYDEVDAGVGADVAIAIGERLRRVAHSHQVLCVTHLHPIAAVADHHLRVEKMVERGRTQVRVRELGTSQRVEEVMRMMGGRRAGEVGRRAAAEWVRRREVTPP
ncbi:MAG: DNA repair protein RecN [Acidobacteria bacterium]|nr:DNA repair protein RecN [Acidobacteriota bacterium]